MQARNVDSLIQLLSIAIFATACESADSDERPAPDAGAEDAAFGPTADASSSNIDSTQRFDDAEAVPEDDDGRCSSVSDPSSGNSSRLSSECSCDFDEDGELSARCGGSDADEDGDKHDALEAEGDDCDDTNPERYSGNAERCDPAGVDEDCDFATVAGSSEQEDKKNYDRNRDRDGDRAMNLRCVNVDPESGQGFLDLHAQYDCDDTTPLAGPDAKELCDTIDNDCDGTIDETEGTGVMFGLRRSYCADLDGDGFADYDTRVLDCGPPAFYVPCDVDDPKQDDCNDDDPSMRPGDPSHEVCDRKDNDCDGKVDQDDRDVVPLPDQLSSLGAGTDLVCRDGAWAITKCRDGFMWCDPSTVVHGCETDVRRLETCRSCELTRCRFSCGNLGCDEAQQIAVGYDHACAVTMEGSVACWGRGSEGRLGNDSLASSSVPVPVQALVDVVEISAGKRHTCAITGQDRALYCWGSNESNQLDSPERDAFHPTPVSVVGLSEDRLRGVLRVALGREHTCAIMSEGVACWGEQANGRLGDDSPDAVGPGSSRDVVRAIPDGLDFITDAKDIRAGDLHTCVLTDAASVECWGDNLYQQLGDPALSDRPFVAYANPVPGLSNVSQLAAGAYHTCALSNGRVFCWGLNDSLQLGSPSDGDDTVPREVPELENVQLISAGASFTCAVRVDGETTCWGSGEFLGHDLQPIAPHVITGLDARALAAGGFTCAIDVAGQVSCWGLNFYGQLGLGRTSLEPVPEPTPITPLQPMQ